MASGPPQDEAKVALHGKHLRIMCIGDSITTGGPGKNGYRQLLLNNLLSSNLNNTIDMVGDKSHGTMKPLDLNHLHAVMGWTIEMASHDLHPTLSKYRPNIVLLHLGTNNIAPSQKDRSTPSQLTALMTTVIDTIISTCPDAVLIVAQITPIAFRNVRPYNASLKEIAEERRSEQGKKVLCVDMHSAFEYKGHPDYLVDVAHPNEEGYKVMARVWGEGLERAEALGWIGEPVKV